METFEPLDLGADPFEGPAFEPPESDDEGLLQEAVGLTKQFAQGFLQGFTTLPVGEDPDSLWEGIARNTGHLMGFVGIIPGVGTAGSLAAKGIVRGVGLTARGLKGFDVGRKALAAAQGSQATRQAVRGAQEVLEGARFSSIPFLVAGGAEKYASRAAQTVLPQAWRKAIEGSQMGRIGREVAREGFRLGTASSVSHWTEGVDRMMNAFVHGAAEGAVFQGIANIPGFRGSGLERGIIPTLMRGNVSDEIAPMMARALASSIYDGGMSTMMGDPLELQVYNYMLGAWFGARDMGADQQIALRWMNRVRETHGHRAGSLFMDPERIPSNDNYRDFSELPELAREEVRHEGKVRFGRMLNPQDSPIIQRLGLGKTNENEIALAGALQDAVNRLKERGEFDESQVQAIMEDGFTREEAVEELAVGQVMEEMAQREREAIGIEQVGETGEAFPSVTASAPEQLLRDQIQSVEPVLTTTQDHAARIEQRADLVETYRDHEPAIGLRFPLRRASSLIARSDAAREQGATRLEVEKELVRETGRYIERNGTDNFHGYAEYLRRNFLGPAGVSLERDSDLYQDLRQSWNRQARNRVVEQRTFVEGQGLQRTTEVSIEGQRRIRRQPPSFMETQTRRWAIEQGIRQGGEPETVEVSQIRAHNAERDEIQTVDAMEALGSDAYPNVRLGPIVEEMAREGYFLAGGVKDKGRLVFTRDLFGEGPEARENAVDTVVRSLDRMQRTVREENARRGETDVGSALQSASGIGPRLTHRLRTRFGSLDDVRGATVDELREVRGVGGAKARAILRALEDPETAIRDPWEAYEEGLTRAQEEGMSEEVYNRTLANAIRRLEIINGGEDESGSFQRARFHEIVREDFEGVADFITDPTTLNKRYQLLNAGEMPLTAPDLAEAGVRDVVGEGENQSLRIPIVEDEAASPKVEGLEDLTRADGERWPNHTDGAFLVRDDVAEALGLAGGTDLTAGSYKGILMHSTLEEGALFGKFAYHVADEDLSGQMRERGEHGLLFRSAAKQIGRRDVNEWQVNQDGSYELRGPEGEPSYVDVPASALTINASNSERVAKALEDKPLMKQAHTHLDSEAAIESYMERFARPAIRGDDLTNELAERYQALTAERPQASPERKEAIDQERERLLERLDERGLETLGLQPLLDILKNGDLPATRLYSKALRHVMDLDEGRDLFGPEEVQRPDWVRQHAEHLDEMSAAQRIMELWPKTPFTANYKLNRSYVESTLRAYIEDRVLKPRASRSWSSVMKPYDPALRKRVNDELGRDIEPGEVLLDEALKGKEIRWGDGEVPLGDAWREFQEAGGWESAPRWMQQAMELAAIRVPADSISGTRTVRVVGFTGRRGAGMVFHPKDMEYMGGADLDIDKAAGVYQDLPEPMMDAYRQRQAQWEEDGRFVAAKNPEMERRFVRREEAERAGSGGPFGMLDPTTTAGAGASTYHGNKMLAFALSAGNRAEVLRRRYDAEGRGGGRWGIRQGDTFIPEAVRARWAEEGRWPTDEQGEPLEGRWSARIAADGGRDLRATTRAAVNYGADAADHPGLIGPQQSQQMMLGRLFRDRQAHAVMENGRLMPVTSIREEELDPRWSGDYRSVANLDRAFSKYSYRGSPDLREVWDNVQGALGRGTEGLPSTIYRSIQEAAREVRLDRRETHRVGDEERGETPQGAGRFIGQSYLRVKSLIEEVATAQDPVARAMRRLALRTAGGAQAGFRLNQNAPRGRDQEVDFPINDLADAATASMLYETGRLIERSRPDLGPQQVAEQLLEIGQFIARQKQKESALDEAVTREAQARGQYAPKAQRLQQITRELREYYEGLDPAFRPWFEQYLIGSLYPQERALRATRDYQRVQRQIQEERAGGDTDPSRLRALMEEKDRVVKEWYRTSTASSFMTAQEVVSPEALSAFGHRLNELAQLTWKDDVTREEVEEALLRHPTGGGQALEERTPRSSQVNTRTRHEPQIERFTERLDRLMEAADEETLSDEAQGIRERLANVLEHYPQVAQNLPAYFSGIVSQGRFLEVAPSPRAATKQDVLEFLNFFERGSQQGFGPAAIQRMKDGLPLRWYHWFMFPRSLDERLTRYDFQGFTRDALVFEGLDEEGRIAEGVRPVRVAMSHFGAIATVHRVMQRMEDNENRRWEEKVNEVTGWRRQLGEDQSAIERIAWSLREEGGPSGAYRQAAEEARQELAELEAQNKVYEVSFRGDERIHRLTPTEAVERMQQSYRELVEFAWHNYVRNDDIREGLLGEDGAYRAPDGSLRYEELTSDLIQRAVRFENLTRPGTDPDSHFPSFDVASEIAREQLMRKVEVERTGVTGEQAEMLRQYAENVTGSSPERLRESRVLQAIASGTRSAPSNVRQAAERLFQEGETVPLKDLPPSERQERMRALEEEHPQLAFRPTNQVPFEHYMPHNGHPAPVLREAKRQRLAELEATDATEQQKISAELDIETRAARHQLGDQGLSDDVTRMLELASLKQSDLETGGLQFKPGHLRARGTTRGDAEGPLPGYEKSARAMVRYGKQLIAGQRKVLASTLAHRLIERFETERPMGEHTDEWSLFMRAYNRDNLGYPSVFPREWLGGLEGKMGPYWAFTDQGLQNLADRIGKAFGYEGSWLDGRSQLLDEIEQKRAQLEEGDLDPQQERALRSEIGELERQRRQRDELWGYKVQRLSQLEGQYQLMTLLSNTRTMVNNLFGGSENTIISAGLSPLRKAKSTKYLQQHVNPDWGGIDDINRFREEHGAVENYIINEIQFNNWLPARDMSNFRDDLAALIRSSKRQSDEAQSYYEGERFHRGLLDLARDYGITEAANNFGGMFMRKTERILRGDAWMAHYVKAREALGMSGPAFRPDHPWLIRMANKGVEATQFVYSNAARPAFARTSLGRIFSRFQLWAWNSVRFRREVFQQAARQGFRRGSDSFGRLQRMMTADLFILGLAELFPFSLFGSSVAPPFDWFADAAAWAFGDEEDREEAFFGSPLGPAQILEPPSFRIVTRAGDMTEELRAAFRFMTTGDWSDFSAYHTATMFPFGRLARDMGKVAASPLGIPKTLAGIPIFQLEQYRHNPPDAPVLAGEGPREGIDLTDSGFTSGGERIPTGADLMTTQAP